MISIVKQEATQNQRRPYKDEEPFPQIRRVDHSRAGIIAIIVSPVAAHKPEVVPIKSHSLPSQFHHHHPVTFLMSLEEYLWSSDVKYLYSLPTEKCMYIFSWFPPSTYLIQGAFNLVSSHCLTGVYCGVFKKVLI